MNSLQHIREASAAIRATSALLSDGKAPDVITCLSSALILVRVTLTCSCEALGAGCRGLCGKIVSRPRRLRMEGDWSTMHSQETGAYALLPLESDIATTTVGTSSCNVSWRITNRVNTTTPDPLLTLGAGQKLNTRHA